MSTTNNVGLNVMTADIDVDAIGQRQQQLRDEKILYLSRTLTPTTEARSMVHQPVPLAPKDLHYTGVGLFEFGEYLRAITWYRWAIRLYERAISLKSRELKAFDAGSPLLPKSRNERIAARAEIAEELANLHDECADVYNELGSARILLFQYREAEDSLLTAIDHYDRGGGLPYANDNLASLYWKQGDFDRARQYWVTAHRQYVATADRAKDEGWGGHFIGYGDMVQFAVGGFDEAEAAFKVVNDMTMNNSFSSFLGLLDIYQKQERIVGPVRMRFHWDAHAAGKSALELLKKYLNDVYNLDAFVDLGETLSALGFNEKGEKALRWAHRINEENCRLHGLGASATPLASLGVDLAQRNATGEAILCFQNARKYDPDDLVLRSNLAEAYLKMDRFDEAEQEFRAVLRQAPEHLESLIGLADLLTTRGEAGDENYLAAALNYQDTAVKLMLANRGSKRLLPPEKASVLFARGYTRVKYAEKLRGPAAYALLRGARTDFNDAFKFDRDNFQAEHAANKIGSRFSTPAVHRWLESLVPLMIVVAVVAVLVCLHLPYFHVKFFRADPIVFGSAGYCAVVFGCLMFLVVGTYLPNILRLKVAGIELEKSAADQIETVRILDISRKKSFGG